MEGGGDRGRWRRRGTTAWRGDGGRSRGRRRRRRRGHRGGGAATEDGAGRANGRRRRAERLAGAAARREAGRGGGGEADDRRGWPTAIATRAGEEEEQPARPSIYRESLRYRVKRTTGT